MTKEFSLRVSDSVGEVDALLQRPREARWLLVLAHGAGAGMRHAFMESMAGELESVGVATLRYQFPYMQHRRGRPDTPAVLTATIRSAIAAAAQELPQLSLLAGGKSIGGRMTSHVFSDAHASGDMEPLKRVRGLVFFGFPLHPPGRPDTKRATHLEQVTKPMLFLQGTRDTFADLSLLRPRCAKLAPRAALHIVDTADHSFHVLKSSGRTDADVVRELAQTVVSWADALA
jgi:uncharacterized protein